MKRQIIFLPLLLTLIVGCANGSSEAPSQTQPSNDLTSDNNTSEDSASESVTSEEPPTSETVSEEPSTSEPVSEEPPTSEDDIVYTNIAEIRALAYSLSDQVNERGIATSFMPVKLSAQLLNLQDYIAGGSSYTHRNKALIANETGYILVSMDANAYALIKDYAAEQQVYDFTGTISLYNGEPEITLSARPQYLEGITLDYTLATVESSTILDVFEELKSTTTNNKGIGYKIEAKTMTLKYLSKLENNLGLFTDGTNLIQVYGHSRVNNNWSVGLVYEITFVPGLYIYKPTFNYISHKVSTAEIDVLNVDTLLTADELYDFNYIQEPKFAADKIKNMAYAELFINAYVFEGYVNFYEKGGDDNISFDDTPKDYYTSYINAANARSMFINNDSGLALYTTSDYMNCIFWEQAITAKEDKEKVEFIYTPYLRNTLGYFQVHVFEETYGLVN
ncbi:MAG: hypothetical protein AB7E23_00985 [Bacilli bacterium]